MAIQETRTLPAPFIETLGQDYAKQITGLTATPIDTSKFAPQVAGQNQLQQQAATLAGQGIGAYQPYIQQAQQYMGPTGYQQFMSPYQTDVIDQSLAEFDRQRQMQEQQIRDQAVRSGNFGGGREGVQLAEFGAQSGRERALLTIWIITTRFWPSTRFSTTSCTTTIWFSWFNSRFTTTRYFNIGSSGRNTTGSITSTIRCTKRSC
jgi:hypothetical protein